MEPAGGRPRNLNAASNPYPGTHESPRRLDFSPQIDREDRQVACSVRGGFSLLLLADHCVALWIQGDRCLEEPGPVGSRDSEGNHHDGEDAVGTSLGDEALSELSWRVCKENLPMQAPT